MQVIAFFYYIILALAKLKFITFVSKKGVMEIEEFTEEDIREASHLAYSVWGVNYIADDQGEEFGLLMCEYIIRYGWYGAPYAFKITDKGKMTGCILAGNIKQDNGYNKWIDGLMPTFNDKEREAALAIDFQQERVSMLF